MYRSAFSLIELMVVIAIIAVLAAIALPLYTNYKGRALFLPVYNEILTRAFEVTQNYDTKGSWVGWGAWSFPRFNNNLRTYPTGGINSQGGMMLIANTLGQDLYPYCPDQSSSCQINIAILKVNDTWKVYCGMWGINNVYDFPLSIYPENCNCTHMSAMWGNGTPGGGTGTDGC